MIEICALIVILALVGGHAIWALFFAAVFHPINVLIWIAAIALVYHFGVKVMDRYITPRTPRAS
jgi:hypothetical protein